MEKKELKAAFVYLKPREYMCSSTCGSVVNYFIQTSGLGGGLVLDNFIFEGPSFDVNYWQDPGSRFHFFEVDWGRLSMLTKLGRLVPRPLLLRWRSWIVASIDSIGLVVRRWLQCYVGKS